MWKAILLTLVLAPSLVVPALAITEPKTLPYPPISSTPTDMAVDDEGFLWLALPAESAVARYDHNREALNIIRLPSHIDRVVYSNGVLMVFKSGGREAFLIDAQRLMIIGRVSPTFSIDAVARSSKGFWLLDSVSQSLTLISTSGEVLRRLDAEFFLIERPASEAGEYLWLVSGEGDVITRLNTVTGDSLFIKVGEPVVAISAPSEEALWVATINDNLRLYSPAGLIREERMRQNSNLKVRLFTLSDGRLYHIDAANGIITEIDGEVYEERILRPIMPLLAAIRAEKQIFYLDPEKGSLGYLYTSRKPSIELKSVTVEDGRRLIVEASVLDRDGDLKEGYPRVRLLQSGVADEIIAMRPISDNEYLAVVEIGIEEGDVRVIIEALDEGGNKVEEEAATYRVVGGRIVDELKVDETVTEGDIVREEVFMSGILVLLIEIGLVGAIVAAIIAVVVRGSKRGRRQRRHH